jgi:hypothetical protein
VVGRSGAGPYGPPVRYLLPRPPQWSHDRIANKASRAARVARSISSSMRLSCAACARSVAGQASSAVVVWLR